MVSLLMKTDAVQSSLGFCGLGFCLVLLWFGVCLCMFVLFCWFFFKYLSTSINCLHVNSIQPTQRVIASPAGGSSVPIQCTVQTNSNTWEYFLNIVKLHMLYRAVQHSPSVVEKEGFLFLPLAVLKPAL